MSRTLNYLSPVALFLGGIAVGAVSGNRRRHGADDSAWGKELKNSLSELDGRLMAQESAAAARFAQIETRLEEQAGKLADSPSTTQIVAAMEQLLSKTLSSLDERLTSQSRSIEVLKTTVSQTDSLLERVLESLDTLQAYSDQAEVTGDTLLQRPA